MIRMARVWDTVHRLYPNIVSAENPFRGIEFDYGHNTTRAATRAEAYALHEALIAAGELHLAAVPLICFEWHQRLTWPDYRPTERSNEVRIVHHKTGELVWLPLSDREGALFPELTGYLDGLERLGVSIVLLKPKKSGPGRPFKLRDARARVRAAAVFAGLPDKITLAACRHGGLTELGDAELTEQGVMALSGHRAPDAARLYMKRTDIQRAIAARKRRAWVDSTANKEHSEFRSQNRAPVTKSE
jgi:hypothetical protein